MFFIFFFCHELREEPEIYGPCPELWVFGESCPFSGLASHYFTLEHFRVAVLQDPCFLPFNPSVGG